MVSDRRPAVLMAVYNEIDFDGRVQRAAEALSEHYTVTVMALDSGKSFQSPSFAFHPIRIPRKGWKGKVAHFIFWFRLVMLVFRLRPQIMYSHDFHVVFPGWLAAALVGVPFVYDAHELIIPEGGQENHGPKRIWYWLERLVIGRAQLVIAANQERAELMREHYRLGVSPTVIENIPPEPHRRFADEQLAALYPALSEPDVIRIVYQGDLNLERGLGIFLEAIQAAPSNLRLVLVGGGVDAERIAEIVKTRSIQRQVTVLGRVPHNHLHDILSQCHIGIVSYPTVGLNNIYCASNKVFEYLQAGLPLLTTCQPPLSRVIQQYKVGITVGCSPDRSVSTTEINEALRTLAGRLEAYRVQIAACLRQHRWTELRERLVRKVREIA